MGEPGHGGGVVQGQSAEGGGGRGVTARGEGWGVRRGGGCLGAGGAQGQYRCAESYRM